MFNLGWGEIALIGIVALIAIGPKELPTVLRTVGQALAKVRRMANEFQGQFQEALREADISDLKKQAEDMASSVTDISKYDPLAETQKDLEKSLDFAEPAGSPGSSTAEALPAPSEQVAVPPRIDIPLPDAPPALTEKDFAAAEAPAAAPSPAPLPDNEPPKESVKQAGGQA